LIATRVSNSVSRIISLAIEVPIMMFVIVFKQLNKQVAAYPIEVEEEGELAHAISNACSRFRRETGISLFDGIQFSLERDV